MMKIKSSSRASCFILVIVIIFTNSAFANSVLSEGIKFCKKIDETGVTELELPAVFHPYLRESLEKAKEELPSDVYASLENDANALIKNKHLTLYQWNIFHYRLKELFEHKLQSSPKSDTFYNNLLSQDRTIEMLALENEDHKFLPSPLGEYCPIAIYGDISIPSMNEAIVENVYPLGVVSDRIWYDGINGGPKEFFGHDLEHAKTHRKAMLLRDQYGSEMRSAILDTNDKAHQIIKTFRLAKLINQKKSIRTAIEDQKRKNRQLLRYIQSFPAEKQEKLHNMFFVVTHEQDLDPEDFCFKPNPRPGFSQQDIMNGLHLRATDPRDFNSALPEILRATPNGMVTSGQSRAIRSYLASAKEAFCEAVDHVRKNPISSETTSHDEIQTIEPDKQLALIRQLKEDPNPDSRFRIAEALRRSSPSDREVHQALIQFLKDEDPNVAFLAARILSGIQSPERQVYIALIEAMKYPHPNIRGAAAQSLGDLRPTHLQDQLALVEALKDTNVWVRTTAANALLETQPKEPKTLTALQDLSKNENSFVRNIAAITYAEINGSNPQLIDQLLQMLQDTDLKSREFSLNAFNAIQSDESHPQYSHLKTSRVQLALVDTFKGPDWNLATNSILLLEKIKHLETSALVGLAEEINGKHTVFVRRLFRELRPFDVKVQKKLSKMFDISGKSREALEFLKYVNQSNDPEVQKDVENAYSMIISEFKKDNLKSGFVKIMDEINPTDKAVLLLFIHGLNNFNTSARDQVISYLGKLQPNDPEILEALVETLQSANTSLFGQILQLLKKTQPGKVIPALARALNQPDPKVRLLAVQSCEELHLDGPIVRNLLAQSLKDPISYVRNEAANVLRHQIQHTNLPPEDSKSIHSCLQESSEHPLSDQTIHSLIEMVKTIDDKHPKDPLQQ